MTNAKHTPGPWAYPGDSLTHRQFDIRVPRMAPRQHVATVNNLSHESLVLRDPATALANARLIAAAPDLLAALQRLSLAVLRHDGAAGDPAALLAAHAELDDARRLADIEIARATDPRP